jgi:hypothetical protein
MSGIYSFVSFLRGRLAETVGLLGELFPFDENN